PAIYEVGHQPILPAANEPSVVTARVHDPDGLSSLLLKYRIDPATNLSAITMLDNGTGGDNVAGDGIYSGIIPGQAAGTLVAFHLEASDDAVVAVQNRFPKDAPERECLVRFGEAPSTNRFGTYRVWMTQNILNTWSNREVLSNERLDVTLVYDDLR